MPFALFETALGPCGIAWSVRGITHVQLPEANAHATRERIAQRSGENEASPPDWVGDATGLIARHLAGEPQDMRPLRLDPTGLPPFHAKVYQAARQIGPGSTVGYAELAALAGSPKAFRAVGQAMAKNPMPIVVPCHRVLAAGGAPGGFSAYGGPETKRRILAIEGVTIAPTHGLLFDPDEATRALTAADKRLAKVIERAGPLRLQVTAMQTPFQALAEAIVYQQLTGKAAATILGRVHDLYGGARKFTPQALAETADGDLRKRGLSGAKTAALKDLAAKTLAGRVPTLRALGAMSEDDIIERLTEIRGIGRWTVEMLLIFRLGRPDVLPVGDYGVRKGFQRTFGTAELPTPKELEARAERWRPFRSAASWYLWRAADPPAKSA
jgi:methylated-DNA-[protein]-cysteine S-methyltransferase